MAVVPRVVRAMVGAVILGLLGFTLVGQTQAQAPKPAPEKKPAAAPAKLPAKIDPPEQVELITKDTVRLKATYYPGNLGKDSVPIIIVHDSKTNRNDYHALALSLQKVGNAVIVPDLRGYGESTLLKKAGGQPDEEFDTKKLGVEGYKSMVTIDLEKVKSFLREKNDAGKLNLNELCVIGVGDLGCAVAVNWTWGDWFSVQDLPVLKQSKDVHALILISPEPNFKNLQVPKLLLELGKISGPNRKSAERMSFFFIVGAGVPGVAAKPKEWRNASSNYATVEKLHPKFQKKEEIKADQTVFFGEMPTALQGGALLAPNMLKTNVAIAGFNAIPLESMILTFIDWRLSEKQKANEFPWSSRKIPGN